MPNFEGLPIEIILEIVKFSTLVNATGDRVGKDDLCKLRLVSKNLDALVSPILFAELHLEFTDADEETAPDCERCQEIIIALATRSTQAFEHTKKLHLCTQKLYWVEQDRRVGISETQDMVVKKIFDAISALRNLRIIRYFCNPRYDPERLAKEVVQALATLPSFQGFDHLDFLNNPPLSFTLQPLSNLTTFRVLWDLERPEGLISEIASLFTRCPDLSEVYLGGGPSSSGEDPTFGEIFAEVRKMQTPPPRIRRFETRGITVVPDDINNLIEHLRALEFLQIRQNRNGDPSTAIGSVCKTLQQHGIYLKGISTEFVSDPLLFSYLASYSGLTELRIFIEFPPEDSSGIADRVYTQILPKHRETLEHFQFCSVKAGELLSTFPTEEQLAGLLQCQRLRELEVSHGTEPDQLQWDDTTIFDEWLEVGLQLPNLVHLKMRPQFRVGSAARTILDLSEMRGDVVKRFRQERGMKFRVNWVM